MPTSGFHGINRLNICISLADPLLFHYFFENRELSQDHFFPLFNIDFEILLT
ncbi:hypothetical protein M105_3915 [Bacteroides fragilis str. 1009-4-F |nr:hypothetical protein M105_3915 [Bacteroides fragilis str. 1009-4-F \